MQNSGIKRAREDDEDHSSEEELAGYAHQDVTMRPGKKTKGRVKIKMEFIDNKLKRYTTFSKRKTGIMKKAYELSTLTGTQVMLLVASETGHVYTFATRKLQPMITSEAGKALIQTCLNSPDPPGEDGSTAPPKDSRMSATGYEETELNYHVPDEEEEEEGDDGTENGIKEGVEEAEERIKDEDKSELPSSPRLSNTGSDGAQGDDSEERLDWKEERNNQEVKNPPVMKIPPHVLSQLLASPGFNLQGQNLFIPGHTPTIPVSLNPPSSPNSNSLPLNLQRRPDKDADHHPHIAPSFNDVSSKTGILRPDQGQVREGENQNRIDHNFTRHQNAYCILTGDSGSTMYPQNLSLPKR